MAKVNINGLAAIVMKEIGLMIKNMAKVFSHGLMAIVMKEVSKMV